MKIYSAHLKPAAEPILVREGFAWAGLLFGPVWLALKRAWIAAALTLAAYIIIAVFAPPALCLILLAGLAITLGLTGHDIRRWSLEQRGFVLIHVVAARGREEALLRLLTQRPDLTRRYEADLLS